MIGLKIKSGIVDHHIHAGTYRETVRIEPPPSYLPCGVLVSKALFPELFAVIGHKYTTGTYAGNGSEGTTFKTPDIKGRFLKPIFDTQDVGNQLNGSVVDHTHSFSMGTGVEPGHGFSPLPTGGSSFGDGNSVYDPTAAALGGVTYTSSTDGGHSHGIYFSSSGGAETRPYNVAVPTFVHSGKSSDMCVLMVPGGGWIACPDYNEVPPNFAGVAAAFAVENIHVYRSKYPIASAGVSTYPDAYMAITAQLEELKRKYAKVFVLAGSAGANLSARAISERSWIADKFVGLYGVYDLNGPSSAGFNATYTDVYLGTTNILVREAASPLPMPIPFKLYHGTNDTLVPVGQSTAYGGVNCTVIADFPHASNPVTAGIMAEIIAFFKS